MIDRERRANVLIVSSNSHVRGILRDLFICIDMANLKAVDTGESGLNLLSKNSYDLCIFDLDTGSMTPFEFVSGARAPRNERPFLPIIMVSDKTDPAYIEDARDVGITEFLAKPITPANFYGRLRDAMERPRSLVYSSTYAGPDRRRATRQFELQKVPISRA